jgi:hypothetical protein
MLLKLQKTTCHLQQHFFHIFEPERAERDQKIIVWIEYFPYKYSFKVISKAIKLLLQIQIGFLQLEYIL